jgi:hypothetical protein
MRTDMPPRSTLTSSFAVSDAANEVVCPLRNQDGTSCRKRCLGVRICLPAAYSFPHFPAFHALPALLSPSLAIRLSACRPVCLRERLWLTPR